MQGKPTQNRFMQKTFRLGGGGNFRWDKALDAAASIETEDFSRKFSALK